MKFRLTHNRSTEHISQRVLYVMIGLAVVIFGLFYLVGYDQPYDDNPNFNAPLLTNAVIIFVYILLFAALGIGIWSMISERRARKNESVVLNGIPASRLSTIVVIALVAIIVISLLVGSSSPLVINGKTYSNWMWLKAADLFIYTSAFLLIIAIAAVIFGATRYYRKENK